MKKLLSLCIWLGFGVWLGIKFNLNFSRFLKFFVVAVTALTPMAFSQTINNDESGNFWHQNNRLIEISFGVSMQDYQEQDTQNIALGGVLNSEKGNQNTYRIAFRWQTAQGLWIHLQAQREDGKTNYKGYLQIGSELTPYNAKTTNLSNIHNVQVGYAFSSELLQALPQKLQLIPFVQFSQTRWQRKLVDYVENYSHTAWGIGGTLQWRVQPTTLVEFHTLTGKTNPAGVGVTQFDFSARQPGTKSHEWQLSVIQDLAAISNTRHLNGWNLTVRYNKRSFGHEASNIVDGLQAPPNRHTPDTFVLGIQKQF